MRFNTNEIQLFIEYYKYFIILRNVLSNYHKTDIKNIKLESIKEDEMNEYFDITGAKILNIEYIINNLLIININLQIKPTVYALYISNFTKQEYQFNYNLLTKNEHKIMSYIPTKYFFLHIDSLGLNKKIISKQIVLKNLNRIRMNYYYSVYYYKIYITYKIFTGYIAYDPTVLIKFNEYSYISKIFI